MKNKITIISFVFILSFIIFLVPVHAETIIYDNITTSNYKYLIIEDNYNFVGYKYDVLFNNSFYGTYGKGEKIFYPDNVNTTIQFSNPIKTDVSDIYSTIIKPTIITGLGVGFWVIGAFVLILIIRKIISDSRQNRKG
jgi:hypothetical protein